MNKEYATRAEAMEKEKMLTAGNYQDLFKAISYGHASAVAAASIFHFTEQTPVEAKKFLASKGIPVRDTKLH